jgi:hypothetical protein|tara:strand:+ start:823 stop:1008 length:186 start_codon:yes stop_codon:yes gene_type:complete
VSKTGKEGIKKRRLLLTTNTYRKNNSIGGDKRRKIYFNLQIIKQQGAENDFFIFSLFRQNP